MDKIMELFLPKMPNIILLYFNEDLEQFKEWDSNITSIEQCLKTEESIWVSKLILITFYLLAENFSKII